MKLIPKEGKDPKLVGSYQGIALCNTDYKVFAVYPAALVQMFPSIFPPNQMGGIRGRSTYTTILRVSKFLVDNDDTTPILRKCMTG